MIAIRFRGDRQYHEKQQRVNERIRARDVRVIDETGKQLGIMPARKAIHIAKDRGLDLVEVAPNANPPVCRILDYGKYKYEQEKQERESKKKHKQAEVKGIRLRPAISEHDIGFKIKNAIEFLQDGDKVKFTLIFRSREITRPEMGYRLMERITQATQDYGVVDRPPTMEGRNMIMILSPKRQSGAVSAPVAPSATASSKPTNAPPAPAATTPTATPEATPAPSGSTEGETSHAEN